MSQPRLLDLFCGAGGATKGYQLAGFYVVGVDIKPQSHYCGDEFYQADALTFPLEGYDAIHASPPCQAYSRGSVCRPGLAETYPDLIDPIRTRLQGLGVPYIIENVPGAPLRADVVLCGCAFGLRSSDAQLRRPRIFEVSVPMFALLSPCQHAGRSIPVYGHNPGRDYYRRWGHGSSLDERKEAMGIDWMTREELAEAIPPAFTQFIGEQLLEHLKVAA